MEHKVQIELQIAEQNIFHYTSIKLTQSFNQHHEFEIVLNHDVIEVTGSYKIDQSQSWIGKQFVLSLDSGAMNFKGIICEVGLEQNHGLRGNLVVKGYSSSILLETGPHLLSFNQATLATIIKQVIKNVPGNELDVNISPAYKDTLPYLTQFKESNFEFLNRLSAEYGDFFYYDGKILNFGRPNDQKQVNLIHGQDLTLMKTAVRIKTLNFSYFSYNSHEDKMIDADSPSEHEGLNEYAKFGVSKSSDVFGEQANSTIKPRISNKQQLDLLTSRHAAGEAAGLSDVNGESTNTNLNIGSIAEIHVSRKGLNGLFNQDEFGKYLITEITHHINDVGRYKNTFKGISADVSVIPAPPIKNPEAVSQVGIVTENNDPEHMGRVKVRMLWQKNNQTTDWIRVLTPDAGSSDQFSQNRGQVFIPELGDQVILGFRYNDPDRPFVMGSIFNGKTGAGGDVNNIKKSISTRSGHLIEFDDSDAKEMITITDKNNNVIRFDTNASSIEITAPEYIRIHAKNIEISAVDDISFTAGNNISASAQENITQHAGKDQTIAAENITMLANDNINKTASHIEKTAESINVNSTKENIELHSSKQIINKSGGKVKLF
ncbi:phage baseplate assembly protein V [Pedobacter sp. UYP1]|uniref:type VI secretion system Vgr family protein n=1 Tax=Pedobacter sp. UYP1 TaxID=1756396 RepID=UPI00339AC772